MTAAETIKHFSIGRLVLLQSMWKEIIGGSNLEKHKKHPETQKGKNFKTSRDTKWQKLPHIWYSCWNHNSYSLFIANSSQLVILSREYTRLNDKNRFLWRLTMFLRTLKAKNHLTVWGGGLGVPSSTKSAVFLNIVQKGGVIGLQSVFMRSVPDLCVF